jgi:L-malate glycosyltransferase
MFCIETMRVLQITNSLQRGGVENLLLEISNNAKTFDLDCLFASLKGGKLEPRFQQSDSSYIRINNNGLFDIRFIKAFRALIGTNNINVIHAHQPVLALYLYFVSMFKPVKHVFTLHGRIHNPLILQLILLTHQKMVFVSYDLMNLYSYKTIFKIFKNKLIVIHNGIDPFRFSSRGHLFLKRDLGIPDESLLFGMVGNFNEFKDQLTICKAIAKIPESANIKMVFIGNDQTPGYLNACKTFVSKNNLGNKIFFLHNRNDIPEILSNLDGFIYSSNEETFCIAVVEAMLAGIPVLTNDLRIFYEITDNGKHAMLYITKDQNDLIEKLKYLISNKNERVSLGKDGEDWARSQFTIEQHIRTLNTLYNNL